MRRIGMARTYWDKQGIGLDAQRQSDGQVAAEPASAQTWMETEDLVQFGVGASGDDQLNAV